MKRLLAIVLITLFVAVNCLSASALADNEDPMCYNANDDSTFSINTGKEEVKRLFPGLKEVESRDVDRSLPIIEVNSVDELAAIINSLNSAFLYKNQPVNERRPKYYNGKGAMVYDMFPGLTVVDSDCEPGFYQRSEILFAFVLGISRELRKTRNIIILLHDPE